MRARFGTFVAVVYLSSFGSALAVDFNQLRPLETIPLQSAGEYITGVSFSPDETRVLSVDSQFRVSLWNVADGERAWAWTLENTNLQENSRGILRAVFSTQILYGSS